MDTLWNIKKFYIVKLIKYVFSKLFLFCVYKIRQNQTTLNSISRTIIANPIILPALSHACVSHQRLLPQQRPTEESRQDPVVVLAASLRSSLGAIAIDFLVSLTWEQSAYRHAAHAIHLYIMHPRVKAYSVAATTLHAHAHVLNRGDLPRRWKEAILSPRFVDFMPRPDWMICWRNCVRCIYRVHTRTREPREFPEMRDSNLRHALSLSSIAATRFIIFIGRIAHDALSGNVECKFCIRGEVHVCAHLGVCKRARARCVRARVWGISIRSNL